MAGPKTRETTKTRPKTETRRPPMFRVLLHNDNYTTKDFVVDILESVFHKGPLEAEQIMENVHENGIGVAGVYPWDVAETKVMTVHSLAQKNGYPLRCSMEPE